MTHGRSVSRHDGSACRSPVRRGVALIRRSQFNHRSFFLLEPVDLPIVDLGLRAIARELTGAIPGGPQPPGALGSAPVI
jgi:hypothetical protein